MSQQKKVFIVQPASNGRFTVIPHPENQDTGATKLRPTRQHIESIRIVTASDLSNLSVLQFYHLYSYYGRILTVYPNHW